MQCGHCYCIECIRILVERASFGRRNFSVKCAICRQATHQGEISYVMTSRELQPDDVGVKVFLLYIYLYEIDRRDTMISIFR
jgi:hypothetical protein